MRPPPPPPRPFSQKANRWEYIRVSNFDKISVACAYGGGTDQSNQWAVDEFGYCLLASEYKLKSTAVGTDCPTPLDTVFATAGRSGESITFNGDKVVEKGSTSSELGLGVKKSIAFGSNDNIAVFDYLESFPTRALVEMGGCLFVYECNSGACKADTYGFDQCVEAETVAAPDVRSLVVSIFVLF